MKVVEVNVGKKIEYSVSKNKITFADELMLNCEKLERDNDECVDICIAKNGMITSGQLGEKYAAQIEKTAAKQLWKEPLFHSIWQMLRSNYMQSNKEDYYGKL